MQITIGCCADDPRKLNKTVTSTKTITATIKDNCDVLNPIFYVVFDSDIMQNHYNYVTAWGRGYFISGLQVVPGEGIRIYCKQDTLSTYADQIAGCSAVIARNSATPNTYLPDPALQTEAYQLQQVIPFNTFVYPNQAIIVCVG